MANLVYMAKSAWTGLLDSIRSKAGTAASMTVSQAQTAVENIPTGGGGGGDSIIDKTVSEASGTVGKIGSYVFAYCGSLTSVSFPNASIVETSAFYSCSKLTDVYLPAVETVSASAFQYCGSLKTLTLNSTKSIGSYAFANCSSLEHIDLPNLTHYAGAHQIESCPKLQSMSMPLLNSVASYMFSGCSSLSIVYLRSASLIQNSAFYKCTRLLSLYLMSADVTALQNFGALQSTPISTYTTATGGVHGSIFVPASLYSEYITATNWSLYADRFVSV